jgi:hypothetical protein
MTGYKLSNLQLACTKNLVYCKEHTLIFNLVLHFRQQIVLLKLQITSQSDEMLTKRTDNTYLETVQTEYKRHACEHNQQKWSALTFIYLFFNYNIFKIQL